MAGPLSAAADIPSLLVIIRGYEFATQRTPVFFRTVFGSTTRPFRLTVLGDDEGLRGFREVYDTHVVRLGLVNGDGGPRVPEPRTISIEPAAMPPRAAAFLRTVHPSCHARGYAYLFLKVLAPELLPDEERLLILDPDAIVLADLAELWAEFGRFDARQLLAMAPDQSDRYYYRLQNAADDAYSPGWRGVPFGVGVNGGVLLLHAARARATGFAEALAALTHRGAAERAAGGLAGFCDLAEQDTLNLAIARRPALWRPLHCRWNYMATNLGGHTLVHDARGVPLTYYDVCPHGVRGSQGAPGDLLQCACGHRLGVLHFVGGVRGNPLLAEINASVLAASAADLRVNARLRAARPARHPAHDDDESPGDVSAVAVDATGGATSAAPARTAASGEPVQ